MSIRTARIEEAYKQEMAQILRFELRDPRLVDVTISRVTFTPDLRIARLYFNGTNAKIREEEILSGFESCSGFIKREMGRRIPLKFMPELDFFYDDSFEEQMRIEQLFRELEKTRAVDEDKKSTDD